MPASRALQDPDPASSGRFQDVAGQAGFRIMQKDSGNPDQVLALTLSKDNGGQTGTGCRSSHSGTGEITDKPGSGKYAGENPAPPRQHRTHIAAGTGMPLITIPVTTLISRSTAPVW